MAIRKKTRPLKIEAKYYTSGTHEQLTSGMRTKKSLAVN